MKTELISVSKLFTETLLRIPDYQRGYSWGEDQLKDFWLDLDQIHGKENHYTGVLTFEQVPKETWQKWEDDSWIIESRNYQPYYIVDGQQRVTTVIILLQAIIETSTVPALRFTPINDIRRKFIFETKAEESARSYIFGYEKDNPSYEYLKTKIFLENSDVHLPDEITIYTKNLLNAKNFFLEKLNSMRVEEVETLFTKVTQQLAFNVYEISKDIDVFVTFETMNNRGKPLSTLELLKNRLIFLVTKLRSNSSRDSALRRKINDAWKSAYHYLGKNNNRLLNDDKFLETFFGYYFVQEISPPKDDWDEDQNNDYIRQYISRIEHLNRYLLNFIFTPKRLTEVTDSQIELPELSTQLIGDFASNLKKHVELYYKLSTPQDSNYSEEEKIYIERFNRLIGHNPANMLMAIYLKESNSEKRKKLLFNYERLLFCNSFGMRSPNFFRSYRRSGDLAYYIDYLTGKINTDDLISLFRNIVDELIKETSLTDAISDWVKNGDGYYGWKTIRYFLFEYELSLQERTKSNRHKLDWQSFSKENYEHDFISIEHIYPQRARNGYWTEKFGEFTPTQKRQLRNSLGNLLPLATGRNSSLSNHPFRDKKEGIKDKLVGYKYGCYSEIEVCDYEEWDANSILERGINLLNFFEKRWDFKIGDRKQKIRALGLSFMLEKSLLNTKP